MEIIYVINDIKSRVTLVKKEILQNSHRLASFKPSLKVSDYIWFDDNNEWFVISKGMLKRKMDNSYVFKYNELLNFEVLENGATITKEQLNKYMKGTFNDVNGIADLYKDSMHICTSLTIKLTTKNIDRPTIYIYLLSTQCNKDIIIYKDALKNLYETILKFQNILNQLDKEKKSNIIKKNLNDSILEKRKEFKELLNRGLITQEEFEARKNRLLNL